MGDAQRAGVPSGGAGVRHTSWPSTSMVSTVMRGSIEVMDAFRDVALGRTTMLTAGPTIEYLRTGWVRGGGVRAAERAYAPARMMDRGPLGLGRE